MRTFDLTPLHRFAVGFDNVSRLLDSASRLDDQALAYPPYNIEKLGDTNYRVTMAVAGFSEAELDITTHENTLIIRGKQDQPGGSEASGETAAGADSPKRVYLHRGIAGRAFERKFQLADHIKVTGAELVNGLLHVDLVREVPQELQPRKISIVSGAAQGQKVLEQTAAA